MEKEIYAVEAGLFFKGRHHEKIEASGGRDPYVHAYAGSQACAWLNEILRQKEYNKPVS